MDITNLWIAIAAAVGYALVGFLQAWLDAPADNKPNFEISKIGATVFVSLVVGLIAFFTGVDVTKEFWLAQMGLYGWLTILIEKLIKAFLQERWIGNNP